MTTASRHRFRLTVGAAVGVLGLQLAYAAGPVTGVIDSVQFQGDQYYVSGWACQEGQRASIDVHIYANHPAGNGTFVTAGTANLPNEPAVDHECHDANGGKHRFRIALPNQLMRSFQQKRLYAHGIGIVGNVENALLAGSGNFKLPSPRWPPDPPTPDFVEGAHVAAFDTSKESCEQIDIPDAPARAFRDFKGTVHLIASHYVTRAGLGPTLETARHNCQVAYRSGRDGNVADFNDYTWLTAFYSVDGKRIVALGHMEYHGWESPGMCAQKSDTPACWYNMETFNISDDGGYHFARPKPPGNYLLSLPARYQVSQGPEGYSADVGIVKVGSWFYSSVYSWAWPPNCGPGKGQRAWGKPMLAMTLNQMLRREPEGNWSYAYFSLIDPKSADASFSTITDEPYLYYVRMDNNHPPYQRVLFRQKVKLGWLTKSRKR